MKSLGRNLRIFADLASIWGGFGGGGSNFRGNSGVGIETKTVKTT